MTDIRRSVVFVFLDGVGLGLDDPDVNPLAAFALPSFSRLAGAQPWTSDARRIEQPDHVFRPIDATLGIDGLPQSGTGQATLFTGVNCARAAGRHYGPFPHSKTREVIASSNLYTRLRRVRPEADFCFANAYPERFFEYLHRRNRWTVTTLCCHEADVPLLRYEHVVAEEALTADLTQAGWRSLGYPDVPIIEPSEAGRRLAAIATRHDLTLFEYFFTDKAGHSQSMARAGRRLADLDGFFGGLLDALDFDRSLLLVTSDHGNLEDLSVKTHTRNPVPFVAIGAGANEFASVESLTDVVPALESLIAATSSKQSN